MLFATTARGDAWKLRAQIACADGKVRDLGRIDRKWWAPRAWFYRYVTYPRLARRYPQGRQA